MLKNNLDELNQGVKGDWYFAGETYIIIRWGNSPDDVVSIPITDHASKREWHWNGDKERPTLHPSIIVRAIVVRDAHDIDVRWHGFLIDGELREA